MKKVYVLAAALAIGSSAYGQLAQPRGGMTPFTKLAPSEQVDKDLDVEHNPTNIDRGTAFWMEDFNGMTSMTTTNGTWVDSGIDNLWKHDFWGTSGEWSGGTATPVFTTASNGFMLFDADSSNFPLSPNYVDREGELTSPSISCTGQAAVNLVFEQELRWCCSQLVLEVIVDNGTSSATFNVLGGLAANAASPAPDVVNINISSIAANEPNVTITWKWSGVSHYYWAIDDIMLIPSPPHEVAITNAGWLSVNSAVPYTMVPDEQNQSFISFGAMSNQGSSTEMVTFDADVSGAASLFSGSGVTGAVTMAPGDVAEDTTASWVSGTTIGTYNQTYNFSYADLASDNDMTNNEITYPFWVTDYVYGRDLDIYTGSGIWNGEDAGGNSNPFVLGPFMRMENAATIYSLRVALTASTDPGVLLYAQIYEIDATGSFVLVYDGAGTADELTVGAADISASPTITEVVIPINGGTGAGGFALNAGTDYVFCVGHYGGPDALVVMNGSYDAPQQTVFLLDGTDNTWYFTTRTPVIRAYFDPEGLSTDEEIAGVELGQNIPNPFNGASQISYTLDNGGKVSMEIVDVTGKVVANFNEGTKSAGTYNITVNADELAAGVYYYTLMVDDSRTTKRMVVSK